MAKAKDSPQIGLEETIVENEEVERMLDERQDLKPEVQRYNNLNKELKEKLNGIETPTPYRIGRYIISRSTTEGRHVEFDTSGGTRYSIKFAGEE